MNFKSAILTLVIVITTSIVFIEIAYTSNNGKQCYTGSPGENACNNCHNSNALNSGGGSVSILSPDMTNWSYIPGTTYTINVKVKKAGVGKFGFGFEALLPSGANGGLIQTTGSSNAKTLAGTILGNSRTNAVHKQPNHFGQDSLTFSFNWTAPAAGTGNITFYAAGNATNSANNSSGDFIYTTNQLVTEATNVNMAAMLTDKKVTIFPNPGAKFISINLPESTANIETQFKIFDVSGVLVHQQNMQNDGNMNHFSVDLGFLDDGVYFVQLQNANWEHSQKLMISK